MAQPNIIVINAGLRVDGLGFMPHVFNTWTAAGRSYPNFFTTTAMGGVSRANFLTGKLASNHGYKGHHDPDSIPGIMTTSIGTKLQHVGYKTGCFGAFVYAYESLGPPNTASWYVAPGWDKWWVSGTDVPFAFLNHTVVKGPNTTQVYGNTDADFFTDVLATEVTSWITARENANETPWFAHVCVPGGIPTRHVNRYANIPPYRPVSHNEADVSDKVQGIQDLDPVDPAFVDLTRINQLTALLAIDDLCASVYNTCSRLANTVMIFMGGGGQFWGEHRLGARESYPGNPSPWLLFASNQPYDEAHHTPLIIINPTEFGPNTTDNRLTILQDVTATIVDWAQAAPYGLDGISFSRTNGKPRRSFPIEGWDAEGGDFYSGTRYRDSKVFTWAGTGKTETYDLIDDPFEMASKT